MDSFEKNVLDFLKHEEKKVLVIKGRWGIGKTHKWNSILNRYAAELEFSKYSYVSLFGIERLKDIQEGVFYNTQDLTKSASSLNVKENIMKVANIVKDIPYFSRFGEQISLLEDTLISNYLICLDDLERRASNLQMPNLLGYISKLVEKHKSKVVLIFNEDMLSENDRKDIDLYREKVIDVELGFFPENYYNIDIVFEGHEFRNLICDIFEYEELKNIRIIKHIKWNIDGMMDFISVCDDVVKSFLVSTIAMLTYIHHEPSINISIGDIKKVFGYSEGRNEYHDSIKKRFNILSGLYFCRKNCEIVDYINHGDFDRNSFSDYVDSLNKRERMNKVLSSIEVIKGGLRCNFIIDNDKMISSISGFMDDFINIVNLSEFRFFMGVLEAIDDDFDESLFVSRFIDSNIGSADFSLLEEMKSLTTDEFYIEKISKREREISHQEKIKLIDVLRKIVRNKWCNLDDAQLLGIYTSEEIYNSLISESSSDLISTINSIFVLFDSCKNLGGVESFKVGLRKALMEISARSKIDQFRVSNYLNFKIN